MLNIKYKLPGFRAESSLSSSMTAVMALGNNDYSAENVIPAVCVPCCFSNSYCKNCDRMCRGHKGEDYYFCMDRCVPGGITWP